MTIYNSDLSILGIIWARCIYPTEFEIKDMTESNASVAYLDLLLSIGRDD